MSGSESDEPPRLTHDLRLLPCAAAAWLGMWLASSGQLVALVGAGVIALVVAGVAAGRKSVPAALACVVLLGSVTAGGLRAHALSAGPVAGLASDKAVVEMVLQIESEPTRFQGRLGWGDQVQFRGDVLQVDGRGQTWALQQAVTVEASGSLVDTWASIMVGATVAFSGRLGTADVADGVAATVRPLTPPKITSAPPWWLVAVERVRSGLRNAAAQLPADQRALVPALTLGDTSQVTTTMTDQFRATGLTHLMAVSGVSLRLLEQAACSEVPPWSGHELPLVSGPRDVLRVGPRTRSRQC